MRMILGLIVCTALSACASAPRPSPLAAPPTAAPLQAGPPAIEPVTLADLRGSREVLVFPDIDVPTAVDAVEAYAARCLARPGLRRVSEPDGFSLRTGPGAPFLKVTVASVSRSSALGLAGSGLTPAMKEAIADTVSGRPRCAA